MPFPASPFLLLITHPGDSGVGNRIPKTEHRPAQLAGALCGIDALLGTEFDPRTDVWLKNHHRDRRVSAARGVTAGLVDSFDAIPSRGNARFQGTPCAPGARQV